MQEVKAKLNTIRENVRTIMERCPETRNNDRMLEACYMLEFHGVTRLHDYAVRDDLPSLDTILRRRREIQEQGHCLPTDPDVARKRKVMSNAGINSWRQDAFTFE